MNNMYFLRSLPMFSELTAQEIRELDEKTENRTFNNNEVLFEEGSKGEEMFLIKSGEIEIFKKGDISQNEQILSILPQGTIFGEMAIIDGAPRSTGARAGSAAELVVITKKALDDLSETHVTIVYKLYKQFLKILSHRLRITDDHYLFTKLTLEKLREF